jgi:hypothetical protein
LRRCYQCAVVGGIHLLSHARPVGMVVCPAALGLQGGCPLERGPAATLRQLPVGPGSAPLLSLTALQCLYHHKGRIWGGGALQSPAHAVSRAGRLGIQAGGGWAPAGATHPYLWALEGSIYFERTVLWGVCSLLASQPGAQVEGRCHPARAPARAATELRLGVHRGHSKHKHRHHSPEALPRGAWADWGHRRVLPDRHHHVSPPLAAGRPLGPQACKVVRVASIGAFSAHLPCRQPAARAAGP